MSLDGGQPRAITPEGFRMGSHTHDLSPDGNRVATVGPEGISIFSINGGEPRVLGGVLPGEAPLRWSQDGNSLFVGARGETSCVVSRLNIQSGVRTPWKKVSPSDVAGVAGVACPRIARDEEHYVFGYTRNLSDLFLVE